MPMPIWTSAKPWYWASSAPDSAATALDNASPSVFIEPSLTPSARIIWLLSPVARMARPMWVPKNASSTATSSPTIKIAASRMDRSCTGTFQPHTISDSAPSARLPPRPLAAVAKVCEFDSDRLLPPITRRLIEYSAVMTRMPASRSLILKRVWVMPVTVPATVPVSTAASVAVSGLLPPMMRIAATAAPRVKLPSQVRSGKLNTRKLMNTLRPSRASSTPMVKAPSSKLMVVMPRS